MSNALAKFASSVGRLLGRAPRTEADWRATAASASKGAAMGGVVGSVAGPAGRATGAAVGAVLGAMRGASHGTDYEDAITRKIKTLEERATDLELTLERERTQAEDLIRQNAKLRASERLLESRLERRAGWLWFAWLVALAAIGALAFYTLGAWLGTIAPGD